VYNEGGMPPQWYVYSGGHHNLIDMYSEGGVTQQLGMGLLEVPGGHLSA